MPGPTRPQPLASACDAHGLAVTLDLDVPPGLAATETRPGVLLTLGRTSALFDLGDVEQRVGLADLHAALGRVLGGGRA